MANAAISSVSNIASIRIFLTWVLWSIQLSCQQVHYFIENRTDWCFSSLLSHHLYIKLGTVSPDFKDHVNENTAGVTGRQRILKPPQALYRCPPWLFCFEFVFRYMGFWDVNSLLLSFFIEKETESDINRLCEVDITLCNWCWNHLTWVHVKKIVTILWSP